MSRLVTTKPWKGHPDILAVHIVHEQYAQLNTYCPLVGQNAHLSVHIIHGQYAPLNTHFSAPQQ